MDSECVLTYDKEGLPYIKIRNLEMKLDLDDLDDGAREIARRELRETPEIVEENLRKLKELLKGEPDLIIPPSEFERDFLVKFLRPCKFYAEGAFDLMKKFYGFKQKYPEASADLNPRKMRKIFESKCLSFLPLRMPNYARLFQIRFGANWDTEKVSMLEIFTGILLATEVAMLEPRTHVGGVHVLVDLQGMTLQQILKFTPTIARAFLTFLQDCAPFRLKGVHIVNQPAIYKVGYTIFKPFLKEKLRKRMKFHGDDWKSLQKYIPAGCLPACYGGELDIPECPGELLADLICLFESELQISSYVGYTKVPLEEIIPTILPKSIILSRMRRENNSQAIGN